MIIDWRKWGQLLGMPESEVKSIVKVHAIVWLLKYVCKKIISTFKDVPKAAQPHPVIMQLANVGFVLMICVEMFYFFYWMGSMYTKNKSTKVDVPKVALITGANRGIGLATARALRARGFKVWLGSRNKAAGIAAADLLNREDVKRTGNKVGYFQIHPVRAIVLDVCSKASIAAAVKHFETKQNEAASASASASAVTPKDTGSSGSGRSESSSNSSSTTNGKKKEEVVDAGLVDTGRLDILINNAGVMVQEEKPGAAPITVATNVTALIAVSNAFVPILKNTVDGDCHIINVCSRRGSLDIFSESPKMQKRILRAAMDTSKVELQDLCKELGQGGKANAARYGWPVNNVYGASKLLAFAATRQLALFSYMAAATAAGTPTHLDIQQMQKKSGSKKQLKLLQEKKQKHLKKSNGKWWWEVDEPPVGMITFSAVCPGFVRTRMGGPMAMLTTAEGAATIVSLACKCPTADKNGRFWTDKGDETDERWG